MDGQEGLDLSGKVVHDVVGLGLDFHLGESLIASVGLGAGVRAGALTAPFVAKVSYKQMISG